MASRKTGSGYRKRNRKAKRIKRICQLAVAAAAVFIVASVIYAVHYMTAEKGEPDPELAEELDELAAYYAGDADKIPAGISENKQEEDAEEGENSTKAGDAEEAGDGTQEGDTAEAETETQAGNTVEAGNGTQAGNTVEADNGTQAGNAGEDAIESSQGEIQTYGLELAESRRDMVNALALNPCMPATQELKDILDGLMPQLTAGCADTYDKVKACYDYLINQCIYSDTIKYDYEHDAYLLLTEFHGSCTYYVAALHYMLLYVGVDNSIVNGYRYPDPESSDTTSFHRWIEINMNGTSYVLDPQWEDALSHGGSILYERFFLTHGELSGYYVFS